MRARRGSALIEFTLVAIPLMFVLISTFEMSRGMWNYHTLQEAVNVGAAWAAVNGQNCADTGNSCSCPASGATGNGNTVDCVARLVGAAAIGIPANTTSFTVKLSAGGVTQVTCAPLSNCYGNTAVWPPAGNNSIGTLAQVSAQLPFTSAIALFWPGAGAQQFGTFTFPATSTQVIQF